MLLNHQYMLQFLNSLTLAQLMEGLSNLVNFLGPEDSPLGRQVNLLTFPCRLNFQIFCCSGKIGIE